MRTCRSALGYAPGALRVSQNTPLIFSLLLASCATSTSGGGGIAEPPPEGRTRSGFPTKEALDELVRVDPPKTATTTTYLDVDEWTLAGPFPEENALAVRSAEKAWDAHLEAAARSRRGALTTAAMHCAARELGLFFLKRKAYPSLSLQAFVLARCGAMVPHARLGSYSGEVPESITGERLYEKWGESIRKMIDALPQQPNQSLGLWFGREGKRVVFFLVSGERRAQLTRVGPSKEANHFVLEGRVLVNAGSVRALINYGRYGVRECEVGAVDLPAFAFRCESAPEDDYAWIEIASFPPGKIFGRTALNALVFPKGEPVNTYVRTALGDDHVVAGAEDVTGGLLGAVNEIRKAAGMPVLVLDEGQSAIATSLAPHYFASMLGEGPPDVAETILLGLRAGWEVEGLVQQGRVTSTAGAGETTVGNLLSTAVERPFGREVLLEPTARRLAIGPLVAQEHGFFGAMLATYSLFEFAPDVDLSERVLAKLVQLRTEAMKAAPALFGLQAVRDSVQKAVAKGEKTPEEALDYLLRRTSEQTRRAVKGWVFEVNDLNQLQFPPEVITEPELEMTLAVSYRKPADEPWGRYVIVIVIAEKSRVI